MVWEDRVAKGRSGGHGQGELIALLDRSPVATF